MKKSNYIQPLTELVTLHQFAPICGGSLVVGDEINGGDTPETPVIIP